MTNSRSYNKYFKAGIAATVAVTGIATVVAPNTTEASQSTTFSDLNSELYYYNDVLNLAERGIVTGFPEDGTFRPKSEVTRGQAAKILAGILNLDTVNVTNPGFTDIPTDHPYYGAIAALANEGIIDGYEDDTFRSGDPVTRNHMAKMIAKAFDLKASSNQSAPFTDMRDDYKNYIAALYEYGVTTGKTETTFDGSSNVTRGQMAAFVVRGENTGVAFTVESVTDSKIVTSKGEFKLSPSIKSIFATENAAALEHAEVSAKIVNGEIKAIQSIKLNTAGSEEESIVFDGGNATIDGNVIVNADYITLKNITVNKDVVVTADVDHFSTDGLVTNGELVIEEERGEIASLIKAYAFLMNSPTSPSINLKNSTINAVNAKRDNVVLTSDVKIPVVKVSEEVSTIQVNADVEKVAINVKGKLNITGSGAINKVEVGQVSELSLNVAGQVNELAVVNDKAVVTVGQNVKIEKVVVPDNDMLPIR